MRLCGAGLVVELLTFVVLLLDAFEGSLSKNRVVLLLRARVSSWEDANSTRTVRSNRRRGSWKNRRVPDKTGHEEEQRFELQGREAADGMTTSQRVVGASSYVRKMRGEGMRRQYSGGEGGGMGPTVKSTEQRREDLRWSSDGAAVERSSKLLH